ncbi:MULTISPECIES: quinone oxidoreductase family protein [Paenibacillus]|uniref:quinone oxidoreductase family protein n=1 Tax=Paenibacillus TaxID=44249 RepID=UPI0011A9C1DF|nr:MULTISPECIES: zinc-binding dehydrogenase [Paenibacillus]MBJ9992306.1 zinc-binding dehydrogenase [Paenibacillus sp. S28]
MKAISFDKTGTPADDFAVLQIREHAIPEIGDKEVLIKMSAVSINPGDFLFIQSLYPEPKKPNFPKQIAGTHGAGIVVKAGKNVSYQPGTLVYFSYLKSWAEYAVVPEEWLIPLPSDYPLEKASQFGNLVSAWDMLEESKVKPGDWLALTAGNSTVATMVSQFANLRGVNVISLVRKVQEHVPLNDLGVTKIIELSKLSCNVHDQIMEITKNKGLNGIIDCVGGPVTGELIQTLSFDGRIIIYGGFSSEKFELHNFDILFKNAVMKAYGYRYFFQPPTEEDNFLLQKIAEAANTPKFRVPIGGMHALEDYKTAIYESIHHPERGKRFFIFSDEREESI